MTVVKTIAQQSDLEATELSPIHEVIDPDALAAFLHSAGRGPDCDAQATFDYEGYEVTVTAEDIDEFDVSIESL
jgi:hypothetical protein